MEKRILISRWLGSDIPITPIYDEASVSTARERVREAGRSIEASVDLVERMAIVASELAHNQLAYSRQGYFTVKVVERGGIKGLEVVAADLGPGLRRPVLVDEPKRTVGSLGAGLEGVFRIADEVEIDSRLEEGVCVTARKFEPRRTSRCDVAIAGQPYPGEGISGDDAIYLPSDSGFLAAVCDGLGHGPEARQASNHAMVATSDNAHLALPDIIAIVDKEIAGTRGCVMSLARFRQASSTVECIVAGDVRAHSYRLRDAHFFTSTPLVLGKSDLRGRRIRSEEIAVGPGTVFCMFTDGLETKTSLKGQLDILRRPAIVMAQHLLETHSRGNDDALAFVARFKE